MLITSLVAYTSPFQEAFADELTIDTTNSNVFGHKYMDQLTPGGIIDFTFDSSSSNLTLQLGTYDIDSNSEIEVLVNNQSIGFLSVTGNQQTGTASLSINASLLSSANTLSFVAKNPNFQWGMFDLLLSVDTSSPPTTLSIGTTNSYVFGHKYMGQLTPNGLIDFTFDNSSSNLILEPVS